MNKCDCYFEDIRLCFNPISLSNDEEKYGCCNGTKERDECSCGGDRTKCDFYPEVREKAIKETEPKFGEWISVKDRLPKKFIDVLCFFPNKDYGSQFEIDYMEADRGYFAREFKWGAPTHWMLLPKPPKGE